MTTTTTGRWLETAARVGERLVSGAQWSDGRCTWEVRVSDRTPGVRRSHAELAGATLYQGTAGIAVFLTELYRHTGDPRVLATAEGAVRHAADGGRTLGINFGFHAGRVGIAYACYRLAEAAQRPELFAVAEELLAPLAGQAHRDTGIDVIGGAAGAIPVLLMMADRLASAVTVETAVALGEHLIRRARRGCVGWSWPGMTSAARDLNGYAHGASGCGHALLELFAASGDARFRYAAEQAFVYERQSFHPQEGNWPDFRHMELGEYLTYGRTEELRARLRAGRPLSPFKKTFMSAWCHGAPGIGLARLRAYEVLGDRRYLEEATAAAETTLRGVREGTTNYSLCHGHLGNCETLLVAARVLDRAAFRAAAENRAAEGCERFEAAGVPWPCGTIGGQLDPSLLLGEAGIGYFFLRLHDPLTPSILCPTPVEAAPDARRIAGDVEGLRRTYIGQHFGLTIDALERLQSNLPSVLLDAERLSGDAEVLRVSETIRARIRAEPSAGRRALLAEAFAVDAARFALNREIDDFTQELLEGIERPTEQELQWGAARVCLAGHVRLVRTTRDWRRWSAQEGNGSPPELEVSGVVTVVYRRANEAHAQTLNAFAAAVVECAAQPGTWVEITRRVAERIEGAAVDQLKPIVLEQLKAAYATGILVSVPASVSD